MQESNNPLRTSPALTQDLTNLIDFFLAMTPQYEGPRRAERFRAEFEEGLEQIRKYPEGYGYLVEPVRRYRLMHSHCLILYLVLESEKRILLVIHESTSSLNYVQALAQRLSEYMPDSDDSQ